MLETLSKILPPSGIKVWFAAKDKKVKQGHVSTLAQLTSQLIKLDAEGWDVYHACAGFKDSTSRKADNVSAVISLWADIDAGVGKPYADVDAAWAALEAFCAASGMPFPLTIQSGYGLHVYWVQTTEITPEQWLVKARALEALTVGHGLVVDTTRTCDLASVLRPPGTKNRKEGRPVTDVFVVHEGDPPQDFMPAAPSMPFNDNLTSGIGTGSQRPSMTEGIIDGQGRTKGMMTRAGWLTGPDGLGVDAALIPLLAWNKLNTPPLDDSKLIAAVTRLVNMEQSKRKEETKKTFGTEHTIPLPNGYRWGAGMSLQYEKEVEGEDPKWVTISDAPVYIDRMVRNETTNEESTKIRHLHPKEGWKELLIPNYELEGPAWKQHLSKNGITIFTGGMRGWRSYVEIMQAKIRRVVVNSVQFDQFGPREEFSQFLLGNRLYKSDGTVEQVEITTRLEPRARLLAPAKKSDVAVWTDHADCLFAEGCEGQGFTLLASFAAPLIHLLCGNEGGGFISLISRDSGKGKTTALEAAASVWGELFGTKVGAVDTNNSIVRQCETLNALPIICDEKHNKDKDSSFRIEEKQVFTDGRGKARMNTKGEDQAMPKAWHTIFIEAANRSFIELALEADNEPMAARVLELTVDLPDYLKTRTDKAVQKQLNKHSGVAGDLYLRYILQPEVMAWIKTALPAMEDSVRKKIGLGNEYRFVYWIIASCAVAGAITKKMGLLHFDLDRIIAYVCSQVREREVAKKQGSEKPEQSLSYVISKNISDALIVDRPWEKGKVCGVLQYPSRNGVHMRIEQSVRRAYVAVASFRKYCKMEDLHCSHIIKECRKMGVIEDAARLVTMGAGTDRDVGRVSCWVVDLSHPAMTGIVVDSEALILAKKQNVTPIKVATLQS